LFNKLMSPQTSRAGSKGTLMLSGAMFGCQPRQPEQMLGPGCGLTQWALLELKGPDCRRWSLEVGQTGAAREVRQECGPEPRPQQPWLKPGSLGWNRLSPSQSTQLHNNSTQHSSCPLFVRRRAQHSHLQVSPGFPDDLCLDCLQPTVKSHSTIHIPDGQATIAARPSAQPLLHPDRVVISDLCPSASPVAPAHDTPLSYITLTAFIVDRRGSTLPPCVWIMAMTEAAAQPHGIYCPPISRSFSYSAHVSSANNLLPHYPLHCTNVSRFLPP
jgi:hypothetical protein